MISSQWQLGLLIGLLAANALAAYRAYRLRTAESHAGTARKAGDADLVDTEAGVVECPDCGAQNELGYRYCRSCVTELPATMDFEQSARGPLGRLTR